jgi:hypothetical protein
MPAGVLVTTPLAGPSVHTGGMPAGPGDGLAVPAGLVLLALVLAVFGLRQRRVHAPGTARR